MVDDKDKDPAQKPAAPSQTAPAAKPPEKSAAAPAAAKKPAPSSGAKQSVASPAKPASAATKPASVAAKPSATAIKPATTAAKPATTAAKPETEKSAENAGKKTAGDLQKKKRKPAEEEAEEEQEEDEDEEDEAPRAPRSKTAQYFMAPFVFIGTIVGFILVASAPIVYVNEILQYFKKESQWPGWTALDGLNYAFFDQRLYFYGQHLFMKGVKTPLIDFRFSAELTRYANLLVFHILDGSVILVSLITGGLMMYFSIRAALLTQKN